MFSVFESSRFSIDTAAFFSVLQIAISSDFDWELTLPFAFLDCCALLANETLGEFNLKWKLGTRTGTERRRNSPTPCISVCTLGRPTTEAEAPLGRKQLSNPARQKLHHRHYCLNFISRWIICNGVFGTEPQSTEIFRPDQNTVAPHTSDCARRMREPLRHILRRKSARICSIKKGIRNKYFCLKKALKQRWFSGRILACHAGGPGSIPGRCKLFQLNSFFRSQNYKNLEELIYFSSELLLFRSSSSAVLLSPVFLSCLGQSACRANSASSSFSARQFRINILHFFSNLSQSAAIKRKWGVVREYENLWISKMTDKLRFSPTFNENVKLSFAPVDEIVENDQSPIWNSWPVVVKVSSESIFLVISKIEGGLQRELVARLERRIRRFRQLFRADAFRAAPGRSFRFGERLLSGEAVAEHPAAGVPVADLDQNHRQLSDQPAFDCPPRFAFFAFRQSVRAAVPGAARHLSLLDHRRSSSSFLSLRFYGSLQTLFQTRPQLDAHVLAHYHSLLR